MLKLIMTPWRKEHLYIMIRFCMYVCKYMGVSLNGGTPKTPQNDHV